VTDVAVGTTGIEWPSQTCPWPKQARFPWSGGLGAAWNGSIHLPLTGLPGSSGRHRTQSPAKKLHIAPRIAAQLAAAQAARGTALLVPPDKKQRAAMPSILLKVIAEWRNRIETTFSEITDQMELARHGAHTFWGLLTRTAATIAAHTLKLTHLSQA
jgi:hypothetical protein